MMDNFNCLFLKQIVDQKIKVCERVKTSVSGPGTANKQSWMAVYLVGKAYVSYLKSNS